jgi:2-desacetyl-2-hydroxyethyl bacteriochlorophyllide A dehydrogenase
MEVRRVLVPTKNEVFLETIEVPDKPAPGEVLVKTAATFISAGTELANYTALSKTVWEPGNWNSYPWDSGYSNVGHIEAVGDGVEDFEVGDHVFCYGRHASHLHVRPFAPGAGENDVGHLLVKVPEGIDSQTAAAARMAVVAMNGLVQSSLRLNDWVAVFGLGSVGNFCSQFFQLAGARVIAVDPVASRRDLARRVGIKHVLGDEPPERVSEQIMEMTGADPQINVDSVGMNRVVRMITRSPGARITVDAVGHSGVIDQAAQVTAPWGQLVVLGSPRAPYEADFTPMTERIHAMHIEICGALEWLTPTLPVPGSRYSIVENIHTIHDLIKRDLLDVNAMISHRLKPTDIKQAYEGLLNDKETYHGVLLDWT